MVGILATEDQLSAQTVVAAFKQGLQELGYVEGKNLTLQLRFADGKFELVPGFATELVNLKVDVIVSAGTVTTIALQKATSTIPIVMANTLDPVGNGLVKTLARPGGNITGLSSLGGDIGGKHLEMLLSVARSISRGGGGWIPSSCEFATRTRHSSRRRDRWAELARLAAGFRECSFSFAGVDTPAGCI